MRILHIVMDGFHPDNDLTRLDISDWVKEKSGLKLKNKISREVKSESKLLSPKMWCKLYSKNKLVDIQRYSPKEDVKHTTSIAKIYNEVNQGDWIWNKLSEKEVPSVIELSYGFENLAQDGKFSKNVSGVVNKLNSINTYIVTDGSSEKMDLYNCRYNGLHEVCDGLYRNLEVNTRLTKLWGNYPDWNPGDIEEIVDLVNEGVTDKYRSHINSNLRNYEKVRDHLIARFRELKGQDSYYVTLSVLETDAIYHTCPPYEHIQNYLIDYIKRKLSDILDILDFDCIIITGDHGMLPAPGLNSKKVVYIDKLGREFKGEKSAYNNNIFFYDHSNTIGAYILSNKEIYIPCSSEYLSDDIYDFIIDNIKK